MLMHETQYLLILKHMQRAVKYRTFICRQELQSIWNKVFRFSIVRHNCHHTNQEGNAHVSKHRKKKLYLPIWSLWLS